MTHRIAILTSGPSRGSNFEAIVSFFEENRLPVEVAFLLVTKPNAPVIERAVRRNIPVLCLMQRDPVEFEAALLKEIQARQVELIALAGFMKHLSHEFLDKLLPSVLNIHPALLPRFGGQGMFGMSVHEAVFAAGETDSGVTVHWVDAEYDHGEIIAQERVDISDCRTPEEIAHRVLYIEHRLYPKTIWDVLEKRQ
jgi:phosphoribosylglycinamide formyltransferase-1